MPLERTGEKGTIRINRTVFGTIVYDAVVTTEGKAFSASEKGKLLNAMGMGKPSAGEVGDNIIVKELENGSLYLECFIITAFGSSIKMSTNKILDYIEERLRKMFPNQGCKVMVRVVGVKSKLIAARNIEVLREWN